MTNEAAVKKATTPVISGPSLATPSGVLYVQPIVVAASVRYSSLSFVLSGRLQYLWQPLGEEPPKYSNTALKLPKQPPASRVPNAGMGEFTILLAQHTVHHNG
jgi:hypothetical protein